MESNWSVAARRLALLVPMAALLSCLSPPWVGSMHPWARAEKFVEELQCGMSDQELSTHLRSFPSLKLHRPPGHDGLAVASRGDTSITLWFDQSGLRAARVAWTDGFTSTAHRHKHDLCSGLELVELNIVGSSKHGGATVLLDNVPLGALSRSGGFTTDVPLGLHELRLNKEGVGTWSTKLRYEETSSGYDRLSIPDSAFEQE